MLSLDKALDRLRSPWLAEEFSPLIGERVLVVDLTSDAPGAGSADLAQARMALDRLPCPSVALCAGVPSPAGTALAAQFDVLVSSPEELEPVLSGVEQSPLAAESLVQLLRLGERLDIHHALVAESWVYSTLQSGPEFAMWLAGRPPARLREGGTGPAVLAQREGQRLRLTLNRPRKRNAFSSEMRDALVEALRVAVCDASLQQVLINGAGPAFCSGGDLDEFGTLPDPAVAHAVRSARHPARLLAACAERAQVEVHGACVGAGVELPAFARRVVASGEATFRLPEVSMGLVPGAGGTVSLPRRIGRQRTAWLALSGVAVSAELAQRWGLVDDLHPRRAEVIA